MTKPDRPSPLARLSRLHLTATFLGVLAYVLIALFASGIVRGLLLLALVAALAALLALTWPVHSPAARAFRVAMLALLTVIVLVNMF